MKGLCQDIYLQFVYQKYAGDISLDWCGRVGTDEILKYLTPGHQAEI